MFSFLNSFLGYVFQYLYKVTSESARNVPLLITSTLFFNLGVSMVSGWVFEDDSLPNKIVTITSYMVAPIPAFYVISFDSVIHFFIKIHIVGDFDIIANKITLPLSGLIYLAIAVYIDWKQNRISLPVGIDDNEEIKEFDCECLDEDAVRSEVERAIHTSRDLPIQVKKVCKVFKNPKFGNFFALKEVSFCLSSGETLGLLGPNGAGKSTLFNILSTFMDPTAGEVTNFGQRLKIDSGFFNSCGICAQSDTLWDSLSVSKHMKVIGIIKGIPEELQKRWLEYMDLKPFGSYSPSQLSSGMKRKLGFAMACVSNPNFKFLDEASTGLDPIARRRCRRIVDAQKTATGSSCLLTTHTMQEAQQSCDRILILLNGKTCAVDSVDNLRRALGGMALSIFDLTVEQEVFENQYLRPIFGGEKEVKLIQRVEKTTHDIESWGRRRVEKLVYAVENTEDIADQFKKLVDLKRQELFDDFSLKMRDLEDLFLEVSKIQMEEDKAN